jgi:hypothetical protein
MIRRNELAFKRQMIERILQSETLTCSEIAKRVGLDYGQCRRVLHQIGLHAVPGQGWSLTSVYYDLQGRKK